MGHDDTSFNGLVKIDRIAEKNAGNSVQFENDIKMGINNGIDLLNFARFNDNGVIFHNNNERIKFKSAGSGNDGDGLVEFPRPGSNGRRGIAIRGRDTDNDETDLLYTFTNASGGDAVNYSGRITGDTNIVTKKYVDDAVQSATPVDIKAIQAAGLQLGIFKYRRSSDSFVSGSIHSNTTTDPQNITQLDIWHTNLDGVNFGKDFYGMYIVPKMFVHIRDNGTAKYIGKITAVDLDSLSNGIRLTLSPLAALTEGSVYYNNQYDVSIGYSRYIE